MRKLYTLLFLSVIMCFLGLVFYATTIRSIEKGVEMASDRYIDWEKLYLFDSTYTIPVKNKIREKYLYVKNKVEKFTSERIPGYFKMIETAKKYEDIIAWNMASIAEYNPIIKLHDGYLSSITEKRDVSKNIRLTVEFADWCKQRGIKFFYVSLPDKICISDDKNISGIIDFTNQNADRFLQGLEENGVKYYDMRKFLHEDGMNHHEAFFRTDHHWKPETGLWAAKHVLEFLRDDYNYNVKPENINPENFDRVIYHDWFLGSQGKKLTLARTKPEDISLIYPKFQTQIKFEAPTAGVNTSGDFSIIYKMDWIASKDLYGLNPYGAYKYADMPLSRIHNFLSSNDKKILVIHNSFSNSLAPFLALGVRDTDEIDLRFFTGSLKTYINSEGIDTVILIYNSAFIGQPDYDERGRKIFDFR